MIGKVHKNSSTYGSSVGKSTETLPQRPSHKPGADWISVCRCFFSHPYPWVRGHPGCGLPPARDRTTVLPQLTVARCSTLYIQFLELRCSATNAIFLRKRRRSRCIPESLDYDLASLHQTASIVGSAHSRKPPFVRFFRTNGVLADLARSLCGEFDSGGTARASE
jgi:hypothetical protein